MLVQFCLAALVLYFIPSLRPTHDIYNPHTIHGTPQRVVEADTSKPIMSKHFYLASIVPCGLATGLDIGLGNFSLRFITLTFYSE